MGWKDFFIVDDIIDAVDQNLLGGASKDAAKQQGEALERSRVTIEEGKERARGEIMKMFPQARQSALTGFQDASNLLSGTLPMQMNAYNQGNMNAQQTMLSGAPQYQNAILGNQVDYSGFQPKQVQFDNQAYQAMIPNIMDGRINQQEPQATYQHPQFENGLFGNLTNQQANQQPQGGFQNSSSMGNAEQWSAMQNLMGNGVF